MSKDKELIEWAPGSDPVKGEKAKAKYGALSQFGRQVLPPERICSMFCGGKKCKYCEPGNRPAEEMTIKGLFSSWVTDNILAMSRPSTELIEKYNIVDQFKEQGIKSVINLQKPGEHASCGPGLKPEGFSYSPQDFMANEVFFYNFGWQDYGVGSMGNLVDMVRVMQFALSEGKVAVHCHAGLGRTGVLIACYLIFSNRMGPDEVIQFVRSKRAGAIQTAGQVTCIREFSEYLKPLWVVYSSGTEDSPHFTLSQFLIRQKHLLHGYEARSLKYIPKILYVIFERLLVIAGRSSTANRKNCKRDSVRLMQETIPGAFSNENLPDSASIKSSQSTQSLENLDNNLSLPKGSRSNNGTESPSADETQDNGHKFRIQQTSSLCRKTSTIDTAVQSVAEAIACSDYSPDVQDKADRYKKNLNEDNGTWEAVEEETDPVVLSALLWDWLDHLQEPVLSAQDLPLVLNSEPTIAGLQRLNKGTRSTVEYIHKSLASLAPLPDKLYVEIIQRCLSTLCHQNMSAEEDLFVTSDSGGPGSLVRRTSNKGEMNRQQSLLLLRVSIELLEKYTQQQESEK